MGHNEVIVRSCEVGNVHSSSLLQRLQAWKTSSTNLNDTRAPRHFQFLKENNAKEFLIIIMKQIRIKGKSTR